MGYTRFSVEIFCVPLVVVRAALAASVGRFASLSMSPWQCSSPITQSTSEVLSFNPSPVVRQSESPFHFETAALLWQENVDNSVSRISGAAELARRNAFGAVKAIAAASLMLDGTGSSRLVDGVVATMRQTGADVQSKYKETSLGGLAVNFVER